MIQIPSISDRQHRPCDTCIFNPVGALVLCNANSCFDYNIKDERTGERMKAFINNIYPDFERVGKLPCRFHITADDLKMILDPYFME